MYECMILNLLEMLQKIILSIDRALNVFHYVGGILSDHFNDSFSSGPPLKLPTMINEYA